PVDLIVVRSDVVIGDGPVVAEPIHGFVPEIVGAEAEGDAPPVIGTATHHTGPPPGELVAGRHGVGLAVDVPATDAGVEFPKGPLMGPGTTARRLVRPLEHGRILRVVPGTAGFE